MDAGKRVLILDDEPFIRRALARLLTRVGFETAEADTNAAAERFLETTPVDLVLMDFNRAGGSAIEFMRRMSSYLLHRRVPVVVLSGSAAALEEHGPELRSLGVHALASKPIDGDSLGRLITDALRTAPLNVSLALLLDGTEDANIDYKASLALNSAKEVGRIAKDILAMANTPGGGHIFVGVGEADDRARVYHGVGAAELQLFDPTRINDAIQRYVALSVKVRIVHHGSRSYGHIEVRHDPSRIELARGECAAAGLYLGRIYHRTDAARSEEVRDSATLAAMIDRCVRARRP